MTTETPASTVVGFEAFFAAHADSVVRALTAALGDRSRAEDVAQEAFAAAYRKWARVSLMERPVAWVFVVAMNRARRDLRRESASPALPVVDLMRDPADPATARLTVLNGLARLAPRQRAAIVLRYLADLQIAEVASAMGCSVGTAKATLHAALANLRIRFDDTELAPPPVDPDAATHPMVLAAPVMPAVPVMPATPPTAAVPVMPAGGPARERSAG
jgi:RNA polymerase sigma-70 factor, ECF subfamily